MDTARFPVTVSAFEARIVASGFLDEAIGAELRELARGHGQSSDRVIIALGEVTGFDRGGVEALTRIFDDAVEGGWGLQFDGAGQDLRQAADGRSLPFT